MSVPLLFSGTALSSNSKESEVAPSPPKLSSLQQLSCDISVNAAILGSHIKSEGLTEPGFGSDAPLDLDRLIKDPQAQKARLELANLGKKLYLLMLGPALAQRGFFMNEIQMVTALDVLCHHQVPQTIPDNGEISFEELSEKTGLNIDLLTRFIRLAICNYVFVEPKPGFVAHTARSLVLANDESALAHLDFSLHETLPTAGKVLEALKNDPSGATPPFNTAFGVPFFEHKKQNPEAAARFAKNMKGTKGASRGDEAAEGFDWSTYSGTIVDVGGGIGNIATSIALKYPSLTLIVEDIPAVTAQAEKHITSLNLSSRVSFIPHDFFTPQPPAAHEAGAYFLSHVLHDWPGDKCKDILRHVISAMAPTSKVVLCESCIPDPGSVTELQEAMIRAQDLGMFCFLGARERSVGDFERLVASVNEKLRLEKAVPPVGGGRNSFLVFGFKE